MNSTFFFEHNTKIKPIRTFSNDITKAKPKPIFRFRPRHPTP